jgi:hypothetical protein
LKAVTSLRRRSTLLLSGSTRSCGVANLGSLTESAFVYIVRGRVGRCCGAVRRLPRHLGFELSSGRSELVGDAITGFSS